MTEPETNKTIRVVVVDDSAVMRKIISDIIEEDPHLEVVGTARNGADSLGVIERLKPDVVTMDIEMPKMDGLTALSHIMAENPVPVIMISAMDKRSADITVKALSMGAVDFISKISGTISLDLSRIADTIREKVKVASTVKVETVKPTVAIPRSLTRKPAKPSNRVILIGASTGGPKAIPELLGRLPRDITAPILIVQHMPEGFTASFADRLNWYSSLEVREAKEGDVIRPGLVLIAPGNYHMELRKDTIHINQNDRVQFVRPSVDILFKSAVETLGNRCIGVILTGMGSDGLQGCRAIKEAGGTILAQNEETCVVYGMPKAVVDNRLTDKVAPLTDLPRHLLRLLEG